MTRLALTALLALTTCAPAHAQDYCGPVWQMRGDLRAVPWREAPLVALTRSDTEGLALELWLNLDTQSWTLLEIDGTRACVVGYGDGIDPYAMRGAG